MNRLSHLYDTTQEMLMDNCIDDMEEPSSLCCGAPLMDFEESMCSKCKEWTTAVVTCQACNGRGSTFINKHQTEDCPHCDDGLIILEE